MEIKILPMQIVSSKSLLLVFSALASTITLLVFRPNVLQTASIGRLVAILVPMGTTYTSALPSSTRGLATIAATGSPFVALPARA